MDNTNYRTDEEHIPQPQNPDRSVYKDETVIGTPKSHVIISYGGKLKAGSYHPAFGSKFK